MIKMSDIVLNSDGLVVCNRVDVGRLFSKNADISVYLRVISSNQCKLSAVYSGFDLPTKIHFDELMHFDFTVDSHSHDAYYFLLISLVAYSHSQPTVRPPTSLHYVSSFRVAKVDR